MDPASRPEWPQAPQVCANGSDRPRKRNDSSPRYLLVFPPPSSNLVSSSTRPCPRVSVCLRVLRVWGQSRLREHWWSQMQGGAAAASVLLEMFHGDVSSHSAPNYPGCPPVQHRCPLLLILVQSRQDTIGPPGHSRALVQQQSIQRLWSSWYWTAGGAIYRGHGFNPICKPRVSLGKTLTSKTAFAHV